MTKLLEQIESRLAATKDCGDSGCINRDKTKPAGMRTNGGCRCRRASRNQREGELAALKVALEKLNELDQTLRVPAAEYVPAIADAFTIIDQALAQITKLMGEG